MKKIFTLFAALMCMVSMYAATETVYFVNAQKWTGTINAYAWTDGVGNNHGWPGLPATKEAEQIAGCDVYSYTAEAGTYANVIFNNGSSQTSDLVWTAGKYFVKGEWCTKEEAAVKLGQPIEYETTYFVNVDGWAAVKIYTWTPEVGPWSGVAMTKETEQLAGYDVYSYTVEKGTSFGGVIFNNGSNVQTGDLKWTAGKYYVKDAWYTKEEAEAKLAGPVTPDPEAGVTYNVTVPAGTKACYIAGEMNTWSFTEMTKVDDTHYTITIETATTAMTYKYCSGPDWAYVEMQADGVTDVQDRTYAANDVVEAWKAVYEPAGENPGEEPGDDPVVTPDPETGVTYNVTVPAGTKACYIAGEMNTWSFTEMTKVDDTHYTITIAEATTAMGYKYCSGPEWAYVEMQADGVTDVQDRTYAANDVVEAWKAVYEPAGENPGEEPGDDPVVEPETGVTYNVTVPAGTKACYIAGEMNTWSFTEMTKVDDTHYTITIAEATTAMGYKYCSGPEWAYVEMQADGVTDVQDRTYAANDVVEAWKAVYDPAGENPGEEPGDDPVVDPETGVTYNVTVPAGTKACYIAGEMNTWSFTEMTKIDDTHYTVTLAEATEAMGYKYCSGPGWAYVEVTEEDGEVANRTYAANDVVVKWASIYDPANTPTPGEAKDITIKAKVPATWTETITAWVWPTGEPGKAVTPTKEGEWYVYTEHCSELNIIFRNGEDWSINPNQTVDITVSESTCIEIIAGTDKATYTIVDCEDNPGEEPGDDPVVDPETGVTYNVTVPAGTKACYIAGEMNTWSFTEMTKVDETHYTITIDTATTAMTYKYCSGPDWAYVEMQADGVTDVQDRTYAANDVVEAWKAVYDPAGENPGEEPGDDPVVEPETGVTYNVTVPEGTKACYIAGEMNTWSFTEMTKVDDTHYTITIETATTAMTYKYCSGPDWAYVEMQADGVTDVQDRTYAANDVVEAWKAVYDPAGENPGEEPGDDPVVDPETGVTYNVTVPEGTKACYIAGEMNTWSFTEMTKVDETHYTITIDTATTVMKYKYCSGPDWAYVEMQADGVTDVQDRTYAANDVVEAWKAVYDPAGENPGEEPGDDPVVDPETGVTYNVTVPEGTKACYIAGEMNTWSFTEMTKVDDTHYTITIAEATEAMGYKYCSGPGWAYVEVTEEDGEVANRTYAANDVVVKWASIYDPANAPTPGEAKDITIKAKVPATWTETITAWVWPTGEPGKAVTPTKEGEWYVYTEHCSELNIIFRNGEDWSINPNQTVDITVSESTCIEIIAGTDKATYTIVDCEENPGEEPGDDPVVDPETGVTYNVTVPVGTKACYIAGEMNTWSFTEMTKVDDTHYTITIDTATTVMKYKYCSGPDWAYVEMQADGVTDVQDRTYAANDVVEAWKAVYDPAGENPGEEPGDDPVVDPETGVTYNVTVPEGTKACYIAGEMNTWSFTEMTKIDETHYTITIAEATTAMTYKYCSGPDWAYVEKTATGEEVADRTYSANDVVEAWLAVYDPAGENPGEEPGDDPIVTPDPEEITIKAKVPASWTNQITVWVWATGLEGQEAVPTQEGEWYVYTHTGSDLNIIYKNGAGWNGDANQTVDMSFTESACIEITAGAGKATYTVVDCEENPGEEPGDDPIVTPDPEALYYITGNDALLGAAAWNPAAIAMTEVEGVYTHTFTALAAQTIYQLKVTKGDWAEGNVWGYSSLATVPAGVTNNADDNIVFSLAEAGDVVVTFDGEVITIEGNFYTGPSEITYVLMGVGGDWTTGIALTKNETAEYGEEYVLYNQTISEGDAVKVVTLTNGEKTAYCGNVDATSHGNATFDKDGNIILVPGVYDFYFKINDPADANDDLIYIGLSQPNPPTALENIAVDGKAVKAIVNGQLVILKDGVKYNAQGAVL